MEAQGVLTNGQGYAGNMCLTQDFNSALFT